MKTLLIKDLSLAADLDATSMSAVRGGSYQGYCPPIGLPSFDMPKFDYAKSSIDFNASQMLGQTQNTTVNNGNNVAFSSGITANVNPTQNGKNTINFG